MVAAIICGLVLFHVPKAIAATGILGLDEAALPVRTPGAVYLVAITHAGNRLVAVGEHGVITYSDDNGDSWHQASVPIDATLTAVAFATPMDGWAAGNSGVILHTGDGGKTWAMQLNGLQANQLTMQAAQLASTKNSQSPGAPNALRRANIFMQQGPDRPFLSILIMSPQQVIVFGAFRMAMRTDDGGKTWTDWSLNIGDALSQHLYGSAQIGDSDYVVGETGLVFRSTDKGAHFPAVTNAANATLFGVVSTGDGVLTYGVAGNLFKTTDGGQSWRQIPIATTSNLMATITFPTGAMLLAAQAGRLFVTLNHGNTFLSLPFNFPMAVADIALASNGDIVAVGNRGALKLPARDFR